MAGSEPAKKVRREEAEERLLIEAAQRDSVRFSELYEHFFEPVYAYVARRARNRDESEELTAEVFRKALAHLPRFKWTGAPFAAWLFRIASNLIADKAKRAAREISLDESGASSTPSLTVGLPHRSASGPVSGSPGARTAQQTELEDSERRAQLFRMVNELADDQRQVLVMRFVEEKSIRDIANILGRSEGAIKQLQFRALENLRARVKNRTTLVE